MVYHSYRIGITFKRSQTERSTKCEQCGHSACDGYVSFEMSSNAHEYLVASPPRKADLWLGSRIRGTLSCNALSGRSLNAHDYFAPQRKASALESRIRGTFLCNALSGVGERLMSTLRIAQRKPVASARMPNVKSSEMLKQIERIIKLTACGSVRLRTPNRLHNVLR